MNRGNRPNVSVFLSSAERPGRQDGVVGRERLLEWRREERRKWRQFGIGEWAFCVMTMWRTANAAAMCVVFGIFLAVLRKSLFGMEGIDYEACP